MSRIRFSIIGSGYRALFYAEIARTYPEQFELLHILCRTQEKAENIQAKLGYPVTTDEEVIVNEGPDFVVEAVSRSSGTEVLMHWLGKGIPVLAETPPAVCVEDLQRLWSLDAVKANRLAVAEQYFRYPILAGGIRELKGNLIGAPDSVNLAVCHDYHAANLIRRLLGNEVGIPFKVTGRHYSFPVRETDSRYGRITDGSVNPKDRDICTLEFANGRLAVYDFSGVQYRSLIRGRHLTVQGERGEWHDSIFRYIAEEREAYPEMKVLQGYIAPEHRCLETRDLKNLLKSYKPELVLEEEQDIFAAATLLLDFGRFLKGERSTPAMDIREGLEDAYTWLLMKQACENPGREVVSVKQPWHVIFSSN